MDDISMELGRYANYEALLMGEGTLGSSVTLRLKSLDFFLFDSLPPFFID